MCARAPTRVLIIEISSLLMLSHVSSCFCSIDFFLIVCLWFVHACARAYAFASVFMCTREWHRFCEIFEGFDFLQGEIPRNSFSVLNHTLLSLNKLTNSVFLPLCSAFEIDNLSLKLVFPTCEEVLRQKSYYPIYQMSGCVSLFLPAYCS